MDQQSMQREAQMELNRREMYRKSQDIIRIYNPLKIPFRFMYDGYWNTIKAESVKDVPRYLAAHYLKYICQKIIGDEIITKGESLKELREHQNGREFNDKYVENREVWDKMPRLDDQDRIREISDMVILGIVEEYGFDQAEPEERETPKAPDFRSFEDQIMGSMNKRVEKDAPEPITTLQPLKKPSPKEVSE